MSETTAGPDWARDMVLVELRRAYPDGIEKDALQAKTGIGPEDLRATLTGLIAEELVQETDEGWTIFEEEDGQPREATPPPSPEPAAEPEPGPEPEAIPESEELRPAGESTGPMRARLLVEVLFYPEDGDNVIELSQAWAADAAEGIRSEYPDLQVSGTALQIDAFDAPRRVWPK